MGKSSFRARPGHSSRTAYPSNASPSAKVCQDIHPAALLSEADRELIDIHEFEEVDHSAMNHQFDSYDEAIKGCVADGWDEAVFGPNFASSALVTLLNDMIDADVEVVDKTPLIPRGHEGNYSVLPLVAFQLNELSLQDSSKAFFVMRTKANTPAFLCGMMAGHVAERGGDYGTAKKHVKVNTTPAGILVQDGKQMVIPTIVVQGTETLAARMLCSMIDSDPDKFTCSSCADSFMKSNGCGAWGTSGFLAFECDHAFHPWCINEHYAQGGRDCPLCRRPLPDMVIEETTVPDNLIFPEGANYASTKPHLQIEADEATILARDFEEGVVV